jgi:hypothetical protein
VTVGGSPADWANSGPENSKTTNSAWRTIGVSRRLSVPAVSHYSWRDKRLPLDISDRITHSFGTAGLSRRPSAGLESVSLARRLPFLSRAETDFGGRPICPRANGFAMSSRSDQTGCQNKTSSESVPDIVLRGSDLLERAHQVGREMERRILEVMAQSDSRRPEPAPANG